MLAKLITILILSFVLIINGSCQNSTQSADQPQGDTTKSNTEIFFKQVMQLNEFKQEQKRVDSIKITSKIPVKLHVDIMDSSFLNEDKGKNISLAFINEDYPYNHNQTMYTVKFDKDKKKIISIDRNTKQLEQSDLAAPEDLPLPTKQ